jgi:hypothetical protein
MAHHQKVQAFGEGDWVRKCRGYDFTGKVLAAFRNSRGHWRYVVEDTRFATAESGGILHIFGPGDIVQAAPHDP